jgi:hypothetical protein
MGEIVRRSITLLVALAVALLVASGVAMARAATETLNVNQPESFTIDNPCTGEPILVEGVFHHLVHVTQTQEGYHFVIRTNTQDVTGTGLQTGDEYRFINVGGAVGGSVINGVHTNIDEVSFMVVTEGASPNFILHGTEVLVHDEDFDPYVIFEVSTVGCTPDIETNRTTNP